MLPISVLLQTKSKLKKLKTDILSNAKMQVVRFQSLQKFVDWYSIYIYIYIYIYI